MNAVPIPTIRPGRDGDVLGVLDLWRRAEASPSSTETAEDVGALLLRDPEALLLAESAEGEIVGSLIVGWDGWRGGFYRLAVDRPTAAAASPPLSSAPARSASAPSAPIA